MEGSALFSVFVSFEASAEERARDIYICSVNSKNCWSSLLLWDHVDNKGAWMCTSSAGKTTLKHALRQHITNQSTAKSTCFVSRKKMVDRLITRCRQSGLCFSECEREFSQVLLKSTPNALWVNVLGVHFSGILYCEQAWCQVLYYTMH